MPVRNETPTVLDDASKSIAMDSPSVATGWIRLAGCIVVGCFVWGVALPRLSQWTPMAQQIKSLEAKKIDGGAMFYTDLEAMDAILDKIEGRRP